jgi:hypothetical protein
VGPAAPRVSDMQREMGNQQPRAGNPGSGSGASGGFGSGDRGFSGGGGGSNEPPDFSEPVAAVESFLNALKARDPERLSQATALRAPYEAVEKHKKVFQAILDKSLPDNELSSIANNLDGFTVSGTNTPKSSGRIGVILQKTKENDRITRVVDVRREKAGWKVLDIQDPRILKGIPTPGRRTESSSSRGR